VYPDDVYFVNIASNVYGCVETV